MCGRYQLRGTPWVLDENYAQWDHSQLDEIGMPARWNVAPTQVMPVVIGGEKPSYRALRFGFVPRYDRDSAKPRELINATAEKSVTGAWANYAKQARCLVPATAFYEWQKPDAKTKIPFCIERTDQRPFAFAGIWSRGDERFPAGFMILTTAPNELMGRLHNRMPVILPRDKFTDWLQPGPLPTPDYEVIVASRAWPEMRAYPISTLVNSPKNDVPEVALPASDGSTEPNARKAASRDGDQLDLGLA